MKCVSYLETVIHLYLWKFAFDMTKYKDGHAYVKKANVKTRYIERKRNRELDGQIINECTLKWEERESITYNWQQWILAVNASGKNAIRKWFSVNGKKNIEGKTSYVSEYIISIWLDIITVHRVIFQHKITMNILSHNFIAIFSNDC